MRTRNHRSRTATILMPLTLLLLPPAGNDGNPGSEDSPWGTIQKTASDAKPGDRVVVCKGTYTRVRNRHIEDSLRGR